MFDLVSPNLRPFLGVIGLTALFLSAASLIHRYRTWQAEKLARAQRLMRGAEQLEHAFAKLQGWPLHRDLLDLCKQELIYRYRTIQELFPKIPDWDARIQAAEQLPMDHATPTWEVAEMQNTEELGAYTKGLTALIEFLAQQRLTSNSNPARPRELREQLRTLRAEAQSNFRTQTALEFAEAENWVQAQEEALRLLTFLKAKAPPNERGKTLYRNAFALYQHLLQRQLPDANGAAESTPR